MRWLGDRVRERPADARRPLQIMYRVDGSPDLDEEMLDHFEGYRGSRPVRIGNGAADQLQLDIYGEALDALCLADQRGPACSATHGWSGLATSSTGSARTGTSPTRASGRPAAAAQDFTYGRLMSWVAFDRAIRLASARGRPGDLTRWTDRARRDLPSRSWSAAGTRSGRRSSSTTTPTCWTRRCCACRWSASSPRATRCGSRRWPPWTSELVSDSLVYRYDPAASPDGLRGSEGTFSMCTFWYVDALARSGRLDDARLDLREDAHLRQPPRPLLRGDRPDRGAARQLPAGVQPPLPDQHGDDARRSCSTRRRPPATTTGEAGPERARASPRDRGGRRLPGAPPLRHPRIDWGRAREPVSLAEEGGIMMRSPGL